MLSRRIFMLASMLSAFAAAPALAAGDLPAFTAAKLAAAQNAGKPVLVKVNATWCPVCRTQAEILGELRREPKYKNLEILVVDYDTQKAVLPGLGRATHASLIVFKGKTEVSRLVGETRRPAIEAALAKAL